MPDTKPCIFCHLDRPILAESELALAFADAYPVSPGHTLIVPKRHVRTIFDTTPEEYAACFALAREVKDLLEASHQPQGFNLGVNCEEAGGQSVWVRMGSPPGSTGGFEVTAIVASTPSE